MKKQEQKSRQYIVFDLEWNQSASGKKDSVENIPFEVIEIGAVKLDKDLNPIGEFSRFVRPEVYRRLHYKVFEIIHIGMEELKQRGEPFPKVIRDFLDWCETAENGKKETPVFCTWGNMDLTELQRNMAYHKVLSPFPYPLLYYDVQKLFSLLYEKDSKDKYPLDSAVDFLKIPQDRPFHRAIDDAYYTGCIMKKINFNAVREYLSMDYYRLPKDKEEEIYLIFPNYSKYISREFETKEEAIADKTVTDMICYRCNRSLRKKIRWFSANQKNYYCLAICPEHGPVRGKIRMKHTADGRTCAIKTIKLIGEDGVQKMEMKKAETVQKRRLRNRVKHTREM